MAKEGTLEKVGRKINTGIASLAKSAMAKPEVISKSRKEPPKARSAGEQSVGKMTAREKADQEARNKPAAKPAKKRSYYGD